MFRTATLKGFSKGLGVVKGEGVASAKKALLFPLKKKNKLVNYSKFSPQNNHLRLFCYCSKMVNYSKFSPSFHLQDKTTIAKILFTNFTKMRVKIHHISRTCLTFIDLFYSFIRVEILHSSPMAIHHIITTCLMSKIFIPYKL